MRTSSLAKHNSTRVRSRNRDADWCDEFRFRARDPFIHPNSGRAARILRGQYLHDEVRSNPGHQSLHAEVKIGEGAVGYRFVRGAGSRLPVNIQSSNKFEGEAGAGGGIRTPMGFPDGF